MRRCCCALFLIGFALVSKLHGQEAASIVRQEFIYEIASFPECHASTIAETPVGLVAAWFGGTEEGHPDVGIWFARRNRDGWSNPVEVANGLQDDGKRHPCWNPVLFVGPSGRLLLFYKVGPSPSTWWGMLKTSGDHGETWSEARRLPDAIPGPIKNKPVMLADGRLLSGSSTEHAGWRVHMEWTRDEGTNWERTEVLNPGDAPQAIQPAILVHGEQKLQILCRSRNSGRILESWSEDGGRRWTSLAPSELPNPNSGIDAVTLRDGRHLVVYNHTPRGRTPLNIAVSSDGKHWHEALVLENVPGEYSYPAIIQTSDGHVHVTYTWKRQRVRYVELDPAKLVVGRSLSKEAP